MDIYSENLLEKFEVDTAIFSTIAERILDSLIGPEGEGSVVFASDERIQELNRTFRHVDRPTDVLSFSCVDDETNKSVIGDVYISLETAQNQARERGVSLDEELLRLMIHGLLHLAGHTHEDEEDAEEMRVLEESLIDAHREEFGMATRAARIEAGGERNIGNEK